MVQEALDLKVTGVLPAYSETCSAAEAALKKSVKFKNTSLTSKTEVGLKDGKGKNQIDE